MYALRKRKLFYLRPMVNEIVLIEVERGKTAVYLQGKEKIYVREKIGVLEKQLKDLGFVRPNSGALVHLRYLERIDLECLQILLELTGELHIVPIARRKKKRDFTAISSLLGGSQACCSCGVHKISQAGIWLAWAILIAGQGCRLG